jgi:hypothetical protein
MTASGDERTTVTAVKPAMMAPREPLEPRAAEETNPTARSGGVRGACWHGRTVM